MRYSHAALSPVSIGERRTARLNDIPVRPAFTLRRLAWKILYSSIIAGVAIYVWWRR